MMQRLSTYISLWKQEGTHYCFELIIHKFFKKKTKSSKYLLGYFDSKYGIEIGGPSHFFSDNGPLPIYQRIERLDNCNYMTDTIWFKNQQEGQTFHYHDSKQPGLQRVSDATSLDVIDADQYEFILASHVIEHIANPIKALHEWKRILKNDGLLIMVVPHRDGTFDRNRDITPLSHLLNDYTFDTQEDDMTHLDEILDKHDFTRDTGVKSYEDFIERSKQNAINRGLHHHVFNTLLVAELVDAVDLEITSIEAIWPMHILVVACKRSDYPLHANDAILTALRHGRIDSPFRSDRQR